MMLKSIPDMLVDDHQDALLDNRQYDRQPGLTPLEREALIQAMVFCTGNNETRLPQQLNSVLARHSDTLRRLPENTDTSGIAPEWVDWCLQWHRFSDLAASVKRQYFHILLRAGRWLAKNHPEVTSPKLWTSLLAAEYVAAVTHMRVGELCTPAYCHRMAERVGLLLSANAKERQLVALRTFFREIQDGPHNLPRQFDPARAFRTPNTIKKEIGPNPRDLDPYRWAKLVHAALHLRQEDLPRGSKGVIQYPLELVRAIAVVWVYSGLRADEIVRLQVGCVRWQREDVTIAETGEVLPPRSSLFPHRAQQQNHDHFSKAGQSRCWAVHRRMGTGSRGQSASPHRPEDGSKSPLSLLPPWPQHEFELHQHQPDSHLMQSSWHSPNRRTRGNY